VTETEGDRRQIAAQKSTSAPTSIKAVYPLTLMHSRKYLLTYYRRSQLSSGNNS